MNGHARRATILSLPLLIAACSAAAPPLETRSYPLQRRDTERPIIQSVLDDELARVGPERMAAATRSHGGELRLLEITADDVAVVRTTPRGHTAIQKALEGARSVAKSGGVGPGGG